jgi:hypothetical protein
MATGPYKLFVLPVLQWWALRLSGAMAVQGNLVIFTSPRKSHLLF